jgi:hypothetical protein
MVYVAREEDSMKSGIHCDHKALRKLRQDGFTFCAYVCGNCAMVFEVKEHKEPEPCKDEPMFDGRPPWGMRNRQA